jgi:hypothetical protein
VECFQQQVEDILYKYGVDFIFFGHVHAYERNDRVYKFQLDPCGPVHITIGDGGNIEGVRGALPMALRWVQWPRLACMYQPQPPWECLRTVLQEQP